MAFVLTKRPVDVVEHTLDFTSYLPDGQTVASAVGLVKGETDALLVVDKLVVASPLVTVQLSAGTAGAIYQVYVTATMTGTAPVAVKRLQFEVQMTLDPEG